MIHLFKKGKGHITTGECCWCGPERMAPCNCCNEDAEDYDPGELLDGDKKGNCMNCGGTGFVKSMRGYEDMDTVIMHKDEVKPL